MRKHLSILSALLVALTAFPVQADSGWLQARHDAQLTSFNSGEHVLGPNTVLRLRTSWTRQHVLLAVAGPNRVFAVVNRGGALQVLVIGARTGQVLHIYGLHKLHLAAGTYIHTLAYVWGMLVIGSSSALIAMNPDTGVVAWRRSVSTTTFTVSGGVVYTGAGCQNTPDICGTVASYAFGLGHGRQIWRHDGNFGGTPALIGGHLYQNWGTYGGETHVYDPSSGTLLGKLALNALWTGDGSNTYAEVSAGASSSSWLGKISPAGKATWKVNLASTRTNSDDALAYGTVYVASGRHNAGLLAVNAHTGGIRWADPYGSNLSIAVANRLVYALQRDAGRIQVVAANGGRRIATVVVPHYRSTGTAQVFVSGSAVYVLHGHGLTVFRLPAR